MVVTWTATDARGGAATDVQSVHVVDTVAPSVTPLDDLSAPATSSHGAVVTFAATATDAVTASPTIVCEPDSGSMFPVGTTVVTCTATDEAGNSASATFEVVVTPTAVSIAESAKDALEALAPSGDAKTDARIATATRSIERALGAVGTAFFMELQDAVRMLSRLDDPAPAVLAAMASLSEAALERAQSEIDARSSGDAGRLAKAREAMQEAVAAHEAGDYDDAIRLGRKAWDNAAKA
jgi:hypothetical protein